MESDYVLNLAKKADKNNTLLIDYRLNVPTENILNMSLEIKDIYLSTNFSDAPLQFAKVIIYNKNDQ